MIKKLFLGILGFIAIAALTFHLYFQYSYCGVAPYNCPTYPSEIAHPYQKIMTGYGPEDFALDTSSGYKRLIISCSPRRGEQENGSFYSLKIGSSRSQKFTVIPSNLEFHPHGIYISHIDETYWLYAISHDKVDEQNVDRIIRFAISGDTLFFDKNFELKDPLLKIPNDLHVMNDGTIYATNYLKSQSFTSSLLTAWGKKTGDIVYYNGKDWKIVVDDLCYPNGIWISDISDQLIVANGACQEILKYSLINGAVDLSSPISTRHNDTKIPMGDNLIVDDKGRIWTANHPCTLEFLSHVESPDNHSPIEIRYIDTTTMRSRTVLSHDGSIISAASTALFIDGHLFISQVFDPYILDIKMQL